MIIATFNAHKYEVTAATDKEFVGIRIQRDEDGTYYMDQHRMVDSIIKEANIPGAKDMHCGLARIWALGAGQLGAGARERKLGELLLWKQCG